MRAFRHVIGPATILMLVLGAFAAQGADEPPVPLPEGWAYDLANELMSPFCPGRTLAECPSPDAGELRVWLVVQEAAGRSQDDVLEELYERYGNKIRPTPKAEGIGLTAYALPIGFFLGGGGLVALVLRRITGSRGGRGEAGEAAGGDAQPAPASPATDRDLERIVDEELAR